MLHGLIESIIALFHTINYTAVFVMMLLESTFVPVPSEIPMIAVGMQSFTGTMNPMLGFLAGMVGVFCGTTINYFLGKFLGDGLIEKYGKYIGIHHKTYRKACELFNKDAEFYTFFGRLIPGVRHLISIPAGMAHMPYWVFITLSLIGSAIWLIILICFGYFVGNNMTLIKHYTSYITIGVLGIAIVVFYIRHRRKHKKV